MATEVSANGNALKTKANPAKAGELLSVSANIIQDAKKLGEFIDSTLTDYKSVRVRLHVAIISAIWHTAKHGNPALLQRVYDGLAANDQAAVKLFLRRISAIVGLNDPKTAVSKLEEPDMKEHEVILAAINRGKLVDFKQGSFVVVNGHTSDQAKMFAALMSDRFINPDGKRDHMVLERDNFAETRTLGDAQVIDQLLRSAKQVLAPPTNGRRQVHMSDALTKLVTGFKDKLEAMAGTTEEALNKG